jgi:hypothetical protein
MQDNAEIITVIRALTLRFKKRPDGFVGRTGGRERDKTTDTRVTMMKRGEHILTCDPI